MMIERSVMLRLLLTVVCIAGTMISSAWAQGCPVPFYVTDPPPDPPNMIARDEKQRDFAVYEHSFALIIGESSYENRRPLPAVRTEMIDLKEVLELHRFKVTVHLDLAAFDLEKAITCFVRRINDPEARVLIYMAGHGDVKEVMGQTAGFFLPVDIPKGIDGEDFDLFALPLTQFVEWAATLKAKHSIFIFDSCFSGAILERRGDPPATSAQVTSEALNKPVRWFMTAGSAKQQVPAKSVFLDVFMQVLGGLRPEANSNGDAFLTGTELTAYMTGTIPALGKTEPLAGRSGVDLGDIVFELPRAEVTQPTGVARAQGFSKLFYGVQSADGRAVVEAYELTSSLSTSIGACAKACSDSATAREFSIEVHLTDAPINLPAGALLEDVKLTCSGCSQQSTILAGPQISNDGKTASVSFKSWEVSARWTLSAMVVVPSGGNNVLVIDQNSKPVTIDSNRLTTIADLSHLTLDLPAEFNAALLGLDSDVTEERRTARNALAAFIEQDTTGAVATQLVRGIPAGSYRYQVGVAAALSKVKDGWPTLESSSSDLLRSTIAGTKDRTLRSSLEAALDNIQGSVYYEIDPSNGWLTNAGQLTPFGLENPPLPPIEEIDVGTILKAESGVYIRARPGTASGVTGLMDTGTCVRVVGPTQPEPLPAEPGGWLQVVNAKC